MDLSSVPKTFWHSLSLSLVCITGTFIYISIERGVFALKWKDLELTTGKVELEWAELAAVRKRLDTTIKRQMDTAEALAECLGTPHAKGESTKAPPASPIEPLRKALQEQREEANRQLQRLQERKAQLDEARLTTRTAAVVEPRQVILLDRRWAKAGYFLALDGDLKLNVDSVAEGIATTRITHGNRRLKDSTLKVGKAVEFDHRGVRYIVKLVATERVGWNRFNLAAYFYATKRALPPELSASSAKD